MESKQGIRGANWLEREKIGISRLKGIRVLFKNDMYDLARWLLSFHIKNECTIVDHKRQVQHLFYSRYS